MLRLLVPALVAVTLLCSSGCGILRVELQHTYGSPKAVAEAVVAALDSRDAAALERIAVTELEFRRVVWRRQTAARPERRTPWQYAWRDFAARSRLQLHARIAEWRPAAVAVVDVGFDGGRTDYGTYRVMRGSRVTLRNREGALTSARLFGSMIEQRGHFKVYSYAAD